MMAPSIEYVLSLLIRILLVLFHANNVFMQERTQRRISERNNERLAKVRQDAAMMVDSID